MSRSSCLQLDRAFHCCPCTTCSCGVSCLHSHGAMSKRHFPDRISARPPLSALPSIRCCTPNNITHDAATLLVSDASQGLEKVPYGNSARLKGQLLIDQPQKHRVTVFDMHWLWALCMSAIKLVCRDAACHIREKRLSADLGQHCRWQPL